MPWKFLSGKLCETDATLKGLKDFIRVAYEARDVPPDDLRSQNQADLAYKGENFQPA
jgi:hypothetical protein